MTMYRYGSKTMTRKEALACAPNPRFFDRATESMTKEQVKEILLRNVREIRFWVDQWEKAAFGQVSGQVTKKTLIIEANRLHDWRVGMDIMSGNAGQPFLWEE